MCVAFYIITRRVGNLFYRIYDWICWILSWILVWVPGFRFVCWNYVSNPNTLEIVVQNISSQIPILNSSFQDVTQNIG